MEDIHGRRFRFLISFRHQVQEAGLAFESGLAEARDMNGSGGARRAQRDFFDDVHE
jgi:hypothetical protein